MLLDNLNLCELLEERVERMYVYSTYQTRFAMLGMRNGHVICLVYLRAVVKISMTVVYPYGSSVNASMVSSRIDGL